MASAKKHHVLQHNRWRPKYQNESQGRQQIGKIGEVGEVIQGRFPFEGFGVECLVLFNVFSQFVPVLNEWMVCMNVH